MNKPIINPATLSEEQREVIRTKYAEVKEISLVLGNSEIFAGDEAVFEWLFGTDFLIRKENDMETKELNLCELLEGHEKSFFVSQCYGQIELIEIKDKKLIIQDMVAEKHTLASDGTYYPCGNSCIIFPSRKLYEQYPLEPLKAWSVWQEEQKPKY